MAEDDDIDYVVRELAKYRTHDEIVMRLCARGDYSWKEASGLVRTVQIEHRSKIAKRRFPFVSFFSLGMLVIGIYFSVYSIYSYYIIDELMPLTVVVPFIELTFPNGGQLVYFIFGLLLSFGGSAGIILALHRTRMFGGSRVA